MQIQLFFNRSSISVVHIYYEESYFRSFTKEELIGFTEFLCMCASSQPNL